MHLVTYLIAVASIPAPPREDPIPDYDGKVLFVSKTSITIQRGIEEPRTFPLGEDLAAGRVPKNTVDGYMYKITDVAVGDVVGIHCVYTRNVNHCREVCIRRRPGGRVPPNHAPADRLRQYHEWANAYQDWEEKGIPLPTWALPPGVESFLPVAPLPREVIRTIPPAKP